MDDMMVNRCNLPSSDRCCGCSACYAICPVRAISMVFDDTGFLLPSIQESMCVNCGKCELVCPVLHSGEPREPIAVFAAKALDDDLRRVSSSGGIFSLLARECIKRKGIVYGAAFQRGTNKVYLTSATDERGIDELRGSKYIQAEIGDVYFEVKRNLEDGREVLFSGCPCQIVALRRFLGRKYENLLLVDVVCHSVSSPLAWKKYLVCQERKFGMRIDRVYSRRNCGWHECSLSIDFVTPSGEICHQNPVSSSYLKAYESELINRYSCHTCSCRSFKSGADITIGDFWGVDAVHPEISDNKGVSAVMCCSAKGLREFSNVRIFTESISSTLENVVACNKSIYKNNKAHKKRKDFFSKIHDCIFDELVEILLTPPLWYRVLRKCKWLIKGVIKGL